MAEHAGRERDRWRSLTELAGVVDPDARREFAPEVDEAPLLGRRELGRLLGASAMLAGAAACTRAPKGRIVAYGRQPEQTPGVSETYATTLTLGGYGTGVLVEVHEGRPTKVEGNPDHPASLGASGVFEQASVLGLYDPDRLRSARRSTTPTSFTSLARALGRAGGGRLDGLRLLLPSSGLPTQDALVAALEARGAVAHYHDPLSRQEVWRGSHLALGAAVEPIPDVAAADIVLALDADLLASGPFHLRHARGYAARRRLPPSGSSGMMSRLYVVEPALTVTGSVADHRLRARRRDVARVAAALLRETLTLLPTPAGWGARVAASLARTGVSDEVVAWARIVARDLVAHRGRSVVMAGAAQPAPVHAMAQLLNVALGATPALVRYVEPGRADAPSEGRDLAALLDGVRRGEVDTLVMVGGNPSYTAPADLDFRRLVAGVRERVYLGAFDDETAKDATWVVPLAHDLESWGDARALDGTVSFAQPMIEPLHGGKTALELLAVLGGEAEPDPRELVLRHWKAAREGFEEAWAEALQRGVLAGTASPPARLDAGEVGARFDGLSLGEEDGLELSFEADSHARDGAFTNTTWLLELPDPITKLTWGNAACTSAATAARLGVATEDVVTLRVQGRAVRAPILVVPGHADDAVTVTLGFGREGGEENARGLGFNAYALRSSVSPWRLGGLEVERTGSTTTLAVTQEHGAMEGRAIALAFTLGEWRADEARLERERARTLSLYQGERRVGMQWAMTIDLNLCTGCSACVVACQAENNVPVVGKEGVAKGRAMHWLRIDRYFEGGAADPSVHHQPMACQHCEKAPCEYVCPVGATVHSDDGLNEMVYNRCVGTRFCSNNCPYKVRRFNWFDYNRDKPETLRMLMNPDVTVRARGVMEKCTYCVQRIRKTEIRARTGELPRQDGDVRTACEQACPTQAITFGSISDPSSRVSKARRDPRAYAVLHELGTEPRTRYLARIRNPNPELGA